MDRRSLLKGFIGAPLAAAASNVIPFPAPKPMPPLSQLDATLVALAALSYTSEQGPIIRFTASDTFTL